ncbi:hypothetical protein BT96DRAFT_924820 [Gymnopus androsaceus JB14]|uniref:Uncharacterized protein n=1 Tax=Gymnopus androsaceus JB14 TaxID=1447944 RepID=A0A6A4H3C5_9AGAR|nr:hypothetical protein BT96DRAFT_924820 [Gymnopus androsaceus JB14]
MYSYSSSSVLLRMLCLLSITRFVAGYRPYYRPHDTSMDLAKSHRSPRFYFITNEGDLPTVPSPAAPLAVARGPVEEPASSPANTSGSPISSPRQIPPEETASSPANSSAPAFANISLPRQDSSQTLLLQTQVYQLFQSRHHARLFLAALKDSPVSHGVSTPPQVRNIPLRFQRDTAAATRSMSSITTRQIHNADYGASSSNAPSSSSSNSSSDEHASAPAKEDQDQASPPTSTKQEQDQKQASSSSAADSTHGTDKREQTEMSDVPWNGRRLPRAVATRRMLTSDVISNQSEKSINDDSSTHTEKDSSTNTYSSSKDGSNGKDSGSDETDDELVHDDEDGDSNPDAAPKRVERTIAFRFRR